MQIYIADHTHTEYIVQNDKWVTRDIINKKIESNQIYVVFDNDKFIGWLRYGLFWDYIPFMNMLYILEEYRGKGIGTSLVGFWEKEMHSLGYQIVLTSSLQTEIAQHFYVKLGYRAIGGLTLGDEPLELIFSKNI